MSTLSIILYLLLVVDVGLTIALCMKLKLNNYKIASLVDEVRRSDEAITGWRVKNMGLSQDLCDAHLAIELLGMGRDQELEDAHNAIILLNQEIDRITQGATS